MALRAPRPSNHLLTMLTPADFGLLQPHLEPVVLSLRLRLEIPNKPIAHIFFPNGIVSVVAVTPNRQKSKPGLSAAKA